MNLETGEMAERDIAMTETAGVGERGERKKKEKEKEGKREKGIGWHRFQSGGFITLISVMDK